MTSSTAAVVARGEEFVAPDSSASAQAGDEWLGALGGKLPPSERDFDLFEQVAMNGTSTRAAARDFQISQSRVRQVVERVQLWILEMTPAKPDEAVTKRDLQMAVALAGDRLDHLYGDALERWRNSDGMVERVRLTRGGEMVTTRTRSHGEPRYLLAAARMVILRSKLPTWGAITHGMAVAGDVRDAAEAAALAEAHNASGNGSAARSMDDSDAEDHPVGDCSAKAEIGSQSLEIDVVQERATPYEQERSKPITRGQQRAREAFFAPAQRAMGSGAELPTRGTSLQLTLSSDQPGASLEVRENAPPGRTRRNSA